MGKIHPYTRFWALQCLLSFCFFLALTRPCVSAELNLSLVADSYMSGTQPGKSHGTEQAFFVGHWSNGSWPRIAETSRVTGSDYRIGITSPMNTIAPQATDPLTGTYTGVLPHPANERDRQIKTVFSSGGSVSLQIIGTWDYYDDDDLYTYIFPSISGSGTYDYSQSAGTLSLTVTWSGDIAATNDSHCHCTYLKLRTASSPLTVSSNKSTISGTLNGMGSYYYEGSSSWTDPEKAFNVTLSGVGDTGNLTVTLGPASAVSQGAQWHLRPLEEAPNPVVWHNSGATVTYATGTYTLVAKTISGWYTPNDQSVTITAGGSVSKSMTYTPIPTTGNLTVTLGPSGAVSAGAKWRRVGTTNWLDSGYTESGLSTGNCTVEFKDIPGWIKPGDVEVTISGGQTTNAGGLYQEPRCTLVWSSYLGGSGDDQAYGIAVDGAGNVFVTGRTDSSGWVSGGFDTTFNGGAGDAFVAKLSGSGEHLWSTYLGGSADDWGWSIALDRAGNVLVTGETASSGWVSGGFDMTHNGNYDAFAVKLSGSGSHLWSTYLGGSNNDGGGSIAVDGAGNVFVTGGTWSSGWVSGGFDTTFNYGSDAFAAKLSGSGSHLWSTYLGGIYDDWGYGIVVDGTGKVLVTGDTASFGWISGGFDTTHNGGYDAFVVELSGSGSHLWSTYLGGSDDDHGYGIALDGAGNVFVTGYTKSSGWVSGGFDTTHNGVQDAFVAELSGSGAHLWSTYLGGSGDDQGWSIAVDGAGNAFVTGVTESSGWVSRGFGTTHNGSGDPFVAELSGSGAHLWSTYLGGSQYDFGTGIAVDGAGNVFVTGTTESSGWVSGGFDTTYNGGAYDAFVAKILNRVGPCKVASGAWQLYE